MRQLAVLLAVLVTACATGVEPPECEFDLSVRGFVTELTFPQATQRTLAFDDYTRGSYHVDMATLFEAVRAERKQTPTIRGLLAIGPFGPLWQYNVTLFVEDGSGIRATLLAMPHARITWKATHKLTTNEFDKIVSSFEPATSPANNTAGATILFVTWSGDVATIRTSAVNLYKDTPEPVTQALESIAAIGEVATTTYAIDLSDDVSIFRCSELP